MLQFSLAFLLGTLWLHVQPELSFNALRFPCFLAACGLLIPWFKHRVSISLVAAFICGLGWAFFHAQVQLQQDLRPEYEGKDLLITGVIAELPVHESYGQRFIFRVDRSDLTLPKKLELTWYNPAPVLHAAERWQLLVRMKRRHGFANPGGYDYEAQLFRQGIGATGYVRSAQANRSLGIADYHLVLRARELLAEHIKAAIPNSPMQGVVRGLSVGDQQAIESDAWRVFARTGTSHLMAISGFHIGMVAAVFAWLGAWLVYVPMAQRLRITTVDLNAIFGMSAAVCYSLLAGMSVPTQRTLIMLAVYFSARWLRREIDVWHNFGLALFLVLLVDPFAPISVGAWLSFGAVAVILMNQHGRVAGGSGWRVFVALQGVVSVGLVPLLLSSFGTLSLVSPVVNLLAIPLFSVIIVPAVLIGCLLLLMSPEWGGFCLHWIALFIEHVYGLLEWASALSWASWYVAQAPWWALGFLVLGTVMIVLPWFLWLRLFGVLLWVPSLAWQPAVPPEGGVELTTLDVGQGLAVVVRTQHHALLYDTGPSFQGGGDTGEIVVLPYLRSKGIRYLDMLMLSHGDNDHVGGAQSIMAGLPVKEVYAGPSVTAEATMQRCQRGQHWRWDGVDFAILHPQFGSTDDTDNNLSCVLRISAQAGSALLLGDIEKSAELDLVASGLLEPTDVIVAAHHGSRTSSTTELIAATQRLGSDQWVIFSTGYRNRWGFPKQDVVERWQQGGFRPLDTATVGAVSIDLTSSDVPLTLSLWRLDRRRYWQPPE